MNNNADIYGGNMQLQSYIFRNLTLVKKVGDLIHLPVREMHR